MEKGKNSKKNATSRESRIIYGVGDIFAQYPLSKQIFVVIVNSEGFSLLKVIDKSTPRPGRNIKALEIDD